MATTWFIILGGMLTFYVVLDGFDLGVGIVHYHVGKNPAERKKVLASIEPYWDGNEVWLLAGGGLLFFAFPKVYAAAFSGFYLPLMIVLWLLVLRGVAIVVRSHEENNLWQDFWDGVFAFSSCLLAFVFGVALANVIREVPLDASGYFRGPLFTNFSAQTSYPGAFDWYTLPVGFLSAILLAMHGSLYLANKTEGVLQKRSRAFSKRIFFWVVGTGIVITAATAYIRTSIFINVVERPILWPVGLLVFVLPIILHSAISKEKDALAFLVSTLLIASLLLATAGGLYPVILYSTIDPGMSLDLHNSAAGLRTLSIGFGLWLFAIILTAGYFYNLYRAFRGKVETQTHY